MKEKTAVLQILGMHCAACATGIESGLKRIDGVFDAKVNFAVNEAIVKFDEEKVDLTKIKATIKRGGYEAVERVEDVAEKRRKEVRRKIMLFTLGFALTVPIVIITYFLMFPEKNYVLQVLTTPVQFIVGWHFYKGAYASIKNRFADMNVLVALSASAAYLYSFYVTFFKPEEMGFFDASARARAAITQANVGIAIGSGADVAIESGDIVLIKDDPRDVAVGIQLSRKTLGKIKQNLFWAFFYNVIMIPLAAGVLYPSLMVLIPPQAAAASMILSDITVVGNSMLLSRWKP